MENTNLTVVISLEEVRRFAVTAHAGQKYGNQPYIVHLDETVEILKEFGYTQSMAAGYLHDTIEDTSVTFHELKNKFGSDVANIVAFCSDEPGENRRERKCNTYRRMKRDIASRQRWIENAVCVKLADRIANVRASRRNNPSLLQMYRREYNDFKKALYVPGVATNMWRELDRLLNELP